MAPSISENAADGHPPLGNRVRICVSFAFLAAIFIGAWLTCRNTSHPSPVLPSPAGISQPEVLKFYTNPGATVPQIPFWQALHSGRFPGFNIESHLWKTPDQLQSFLLAGTGDIWLGHIEGFARARARGGPVVLVAVTGWRKMSILTRDPAVHSVDDLWGKPLPFAPFGSPAVPALTALTPDGAQPPVFQPNEPRQLAARLAAGEISTVLLPEPLVTLVLRKNPDLRVLACLEDLHARRHGGPARLPWAGIAVHEQILREHPDFVTDLVSAMKEAAAGLRDNPRLAASALPGEFSEFIPADVVAASLERDIILVESACDVVPELREFLGLVTPELRNEKGEIPILESAFIWIPGRTQ